MAISRREVVAQTGTYLAATACMPAIAQSPAPKKLAPKLQIFIPAMTRTALDEAGRALGDALVIAGLCDEIEYENREGKGGAAGLAYYAEKYAREPNHMMVGDSSLAGALALHKSPVDLARVQPLARLTNDYLVVAVAAASPIKTVADLAERLRTNTRQTSIAMGTSGSVDHVFAGLLTKAAGASLDEASFVHFTRGFELVDALLGGKAVLAVSSYRTFNSELASGKLRALGVSSRRSSYGIKSVREQGMDVELTNWRAVFTGPQVAPARQAEMVEAIRLATADSAWKKSLKEGFWEPSWLAGADLRNFLDLDTKTAQLMVQLLKLKG